MGNIVQCWLPGSKPKGLPRGNRAPTQDEVAYCYQHHLGPTLKRLGFDKPNHWVFTVGAPASEFFLGVNKTEKYLGTINQRDLP